MNLKKTIINDVNELSYEVVFDWEFYGGLYHEMFLT